MTHQTWHRDGFSISTDRSRLDLAVIHGFLKGSYWAEGIPREVVERSLTHALVFGLYAPDAAQIGFARAITDRATFAYLGDVFVLVDWRRRGFGAWLVECVMGHPDLQGLRQWFLLTRDAHAFYARFGFEPVQDASRLMVRADPEVYRRGTAGWSPAARCSAGAASGGA